MPSSALAGKPRKRFTPEEYLSLERAATEKSEYYDGEIFAMSGAREDHNILALRLGSMLLSALSGTGCQAYPSDLKVAVTRQGPFFYPDVSVVCGTREFLDSRREVLLNPSLIIEVLSKSTQRFDRSIKLVEYHRIPSVRAILLVSSDRVSVEAHVRSGRVWKHHTVTSLDRSIDLASPPCSLPLATIYADVEFAKSAKSPPHVAR